MPLTSTPEGLAALREMVTEVMAALQPPPKLSVAQWADRERRLSSEASAEPGVYESSPGVRRLFCQRCGTPMAYDADRFKHEIHFYAASLDDSENYAPEFHVHCGEQLAWLNVVDDVPIYDKGVVRKASV